MKMRPESPHCREGDGYAAMQLRERRLDLQALDSEGHLVEMAPSDYRSCRRSLLQAIDELETLLRTHGDGLTNTCQTQRQKDKLPRNLLKGSQKRFR